MSNKELGEILEPYCIFCWSSKFSNNKEVTLHQMSVDSNGKSICPKLVEWGCRTDLHQAPPWHVFKV